MFKIKANPIFPCVVKVPVAGEGTADLKLTFKHKTRAEAADFVNRARSFNGTDGEFLGEIVEGWSDVDTEYSPDAMTKVCQNYAGAGPAIIDAYLDELGVARLKN